MELSVFVAVALQAAEALAQGMLRFGCSQLVIECINPIVIARHQGVVGNSLNTTAGSRSHSTFTATEYTHPRSWMGPANHDPPKLSTCTSCTYSEDFSNSWTASMYFTYRLVPQMANYRNRSSPELLQQKGGATVYYMQPFGGASKTTAFKPGLQARLPHDRRKPGPPKQGRHVSGHLPPLQRQGRGQRQRRRALRFGRLVQLLNSFHPQEVT